MKKQHTHTKQIKYAIETAYLSTILLYIFIMIFIGPQSSKLIQIYLPGMKGTETKITACF